MNKVWTAAVVAKQLVALVGAHGAPNQFQFQLHEIANDVGTRVDVLAISRIARSQAEAVDRELVAHGLQATYCLRLHDRPALIQVRRLPALPLQAVGKGAAGLRAGRIVVTLQGAGAKTWAFVDGQFEALPAGEYEVFARPVAPTRDVAHEQLLADNARCDAARPAGDA